MIWLGVLVLFFLLAWRSSKIDKSPSAAFDPFSILGIDPGADLATIKKQYRVLSLQWHPDRNQGNPEAEKKFILIAKAYKTLTDEEAKKNWELYGNPDGIQSFSMGIALPSWLVKQGNMIWVLGVYSICFGVILPVCVGKWWYTSRKYTKDKILHQTMALYYQELKDSLPVKKIIEILTASLEFKEELPLRPTDNQILPKIELQLSDWEKSKRYNAPYCEKANLLLTAHLSRIQHEDPFFLKDQAFVVGKSVHLLQGILQMAVARQWLQTMLASIDLSSMIVQALWQHQSSLLQLPHISSDMLRHFRTKKRDIRTVPQLLELPEEERRSLLRQLTDEQYVELMRVARKLPCIDVTATFTVVDEEKVTVGSVVSLLVKIKLVSSEQSNHVEPIEFVEGGKDMSVDALAKSTVLPIINEVEPVYAPLFPRPKRPIWYIILADQRGMKMVTWPERIVDLQGERTVNLMFQAPPKAGVCMFTLFVKSDSYVGYELKKELKVSKSRVLTVYLFTTNILILFYVLLVTNLRGFREILSTYGGLWTPE